MHGTGVCAQALTPDRQLRRMLQARRAGGLPRWKKVKRGGSARDGRYLAAEPLSR
ncbi:hypothetical protein C7S16_2059 [Burkholderia thailandensis]|uniref:Uncharacterized protein n=1 Tax=Burkholderia thailandensis TaxID=57975 RepID=A0AAW9CSK9_BURTH|nr:hypothetical protein [Burkholderia thailandensis]